MFRQAKSLLLISNLSRLELHQKQKPVSMTVMFQLSDTFKDAQYSMRYQIYIVCTLFIYIKYHLLLKIDHKTTNQPKKKKIKGLDIFISWSIHYLGQRTPFFLKASSHFPIRISLPYTGNSKPGSQMIPLLRKNL